MTELQKKMLEMLCEIDEICRKHNIEYCLFAGTGLGADRHNGFIPWDDDADILMTLNNYEKFLRVFDKEAKENRVLNCLEKSSEYPFTYARYVDTSTTAIQRHTAFGGCDPGVKIDIFVAVPTNNKLEKAQEHRLEILAFSELICPYAIMHHHRPAGYAAVYEREQKLFERLGREKYIKKRMPKLKYYSRRETGRYVLFSGMMCNSYLFDAETLNKTKYVPFEDTELMVSADNIALSKELYGEGWISKPANVEIPRHTFLLDMDRSYDEYLELLWQNFDFETAETTAATRRDMHLYERESFRDVIINNQNLKNLAVEMDMNRRYSQLSEAQRSNWAALYQMFGTYYAAQLRGIQKHYQLFIGLDPETFVAAMNAAIMMDRYYEAADIMNIGIAADRLSTDDPGVRQILSRLDTCRDITEALYVRKDFNELTELLSEIEDEWLNGSLTVIVASMWAAVCQGESSETLCQQIDVYTRELGVIGELLAVKGYCLEKAGDAGGAAAVYREALTNVRNGCVYQWLTDKGTDTYEK